MADRPWILNGEHVLSICEQTSRAPGMYLDEIQDCVAPIMRTSISVRALSVLVRDEDYLFKMLHKAVSEQDEEERAMFRNWDGGGGRPWWPGQSLECALPYDSRRLAWGFLGIRDRSSIQLRASEHVSIPSKGPGTLIFEEQRQSGGVPLLDIGPSLERAAAAGVPVRAGEWDGVRRLEVLSTMALANYGGGDIIAVSKFCSRTR